MPISRRKAIGQALLGAGMMGLGQHLRATELGLGTEAEMPYRHSACRWCYSDIPLEEFAERGLDIGLQSIELLNPREWPVVHKRGLECAVATDHFAVITEGFNDKKNHRRLQEAYVPLIRQAAAAGIPNVICFSGNRRGMSDKKGLENCARGLAPLVREAKVAGVTLIMELLNSKVDHIDYMCDHTEWGVQLVQKIGSPHFRLLYDIYHMQIMEGDIIASIRKYHPFIQHYHTGGVPGRHEINSQQELNYPAIVRAIADTGYRGFLGQEFIPTYENKIEALEEGLEICTIE